MTLINEHYNKLNASYLFSQIRKRVIQFETEKPEARVIKLGIGDVTRPLPTVAIDAFHKAIDEMANPGTFRGYGPEQGYQFLREAIAEIDFHRRGVTHITADDIFVSDGAKCDCANIQEIFSLDSTIAISDPVYPVYLDSNVMAGRSGNFENGRYQGIHYLECTESNHFSPSIPDVPLDLIYLCSPNNPTGTVLSKEDLKAWVDYALKNNSIILFDAAYETFIRDDNLPRSIFEIEGAEKVAIEFRSLSKSAGFTGIRCAFTVIHKDCMGRTSSGKEISIRDLWFRRQSTKFNGVSYPVQQATKAVYTEEGQAEVKVLTDYYLKNASLLRTALEGKGLTVFGGIDSPYLWTKTNRDSWEFFDDMLQNYGLVCTPGVGFGNCGQGYVRFSAFNEREAIVEASERLAAG